MSPLLVVLGDIAVDVVVAVHEPPAPGSDTRSTNRLIGGGAGANAAAWAAAAGARVALVGRVGADLHGREQVADLRARGVEVHAAVDASRPTGLVVAIATPDGERAFYPDRGANLGLTPGDLPAAVIRAASHLHVSGYMLLDEASRPAALAAISQAGAVGATTSVDLASAAPLARAGAEAVRGWIAEVDVCRGNAAEAAVLTGAGSAREAARHLGDRHRVAVVTDGMAGAWAVAGDEEHHTPAPSVALVDAVGAGDAFTAGFLAAWVRGAPVGDALRAGAGLAGRAVSSPGARPGSE